MLAACDTADKVSVPLHSDSKYLPGASMPCAAWVPSTTDLPSAHGACRVGRAQEGLMAQMSLRKEAWANTWWPMCTGSRLALNRKRLWCLRMSPDDIILANGARHRRPAPPCVLPEASVGTAVQPGMYEAHCAVHSEWTARVPCGLQLNDAVLWSQWQRVSPGRRKAGPRPQVRRLAGGKGTGWALASGESRAGGDGWCGILAMWARARGIQASGPCGNIPTAASLQRGHDPVCTSVHVVSIRAGPPALLGPPCMLVGGLSGGPA